MCLLLLLLAKQVATCAPGISMCVVHGALSHLSMHACAAFAQATSLQARCWLLLMQGCRDFLEPLLAQERSALAERARAAALQPTLAW